MAKKKKKVAKPGFLKKVIKTLWISFISFLLIFFIYFYAVSIDLFGLFGGMPGFRNLESPENDYSSELISADGESLGRYYLFNRTRATYDELSEDLVTTLVSSEDRRFYDHPGIDLISLLRASSGWATGRRLGGGSTLTMQLAENLFKTNTENEGWFYRFGKVKPLIIKSKEWLIALQLERNFTKKEILAMYLNTVPFGSGTFGIKAAAEKYFGKTPAELNLQESAVLIGILQGSTAFNPRINPDRSFNKRNEVLYKVLKFSDLIATEEQYDSITKLPLELSNRRNKSQQQDLTSYFQAEIRKDLEVWAREKGYDLYNDGLKIYTTIDSRMQQYAELAVQGQMQTLQKRFKKLWKGQNPWRDSRNRELEGFLDRKIKNTDLYRSLRKTYASKPDSIDIVLNTPRRMTIFTYAGEVDTLMSPMDSLSHYSKFLHSGFMAMNAKTGEIKAWIGGIDHNYFKFDHVRQSKRQPGSTFKPFVYALALDNGYSPCYELEDIAPVFKLPNGDTWSPENAEGGHGTGEKMTTRQAMAQSINSITAQLMQKVGMQNVVNFAHQIGIESELDAVPSLCLGTSEVSLYELIGAYGTFVNQGVHTKPYYISRIEDKYGNIIESFVPKAREAMNEELAYMMIHMLKGGVEEEGGTSRALNKAILVDNEVGGKTGTTNSASDGWYMGVTKDLVAGAWVGGDEPSIRFPRWYQGQGGVTARPIWESFMLKVYADKDLDYEKGAFKKPMTDLPYSLDCGAYQTDDEPKPEKWQEEDAE
ncbi:MAG: transglycosylase domain-containing protein [Bacteroidota bacterium]